MDHCFHCWAGFVSAYLAGIQQGVECLSSQQLTVQQRSLKSLQILSSQLPIVPVTGVPKLLLLQHDVHSVKGCCLL